MERAQPEEIKYTVEKTDKADRIDRFLSVKLNNFTRSQVQSLCDSDRVFANGISVAKNYRVRVGDRLTVQPAEDPMGPPAAQDLSLEVLYHDEYLSVINKPKGMLVHPTPHQQRDTLANGLVYLYGDNLSQSGGVYRPGIVHRLDQDTSGLLLVAHTDKIHQQLSLLLQRRELRRYYRAVVHGHVHPAKGEIDKPIGRNPANPTQMTVLESGRPARTLYSVREYVGNYSDVDIQLITGRTHQIRVHFQSIGHAVAGDPIYHTGQSLAPVSDQCLHGARLEFSHPVSGKEMKICSPLPAYYTTFLKLLKRI